MATPSGSSSGGGSGWGKLFGLPTYVVVGAAAVLLFLWYRHQQAAAAAAAAAGATTGTGEAGGPLGGGIGGAGGGGITTGGTGTGTFNDNTAWYQAASAALQSLGDNALAVQQALTDFLNGQPLSSSEAGIINQALGAIGPPPTPLSVNLASTGSTSTGTAGSGGGPQGSGTGPGQTGTPPPLSPAGIAAPTVGSAGESLVATPNPAVVLTGSGPGGSYLPGEHATPADLATSIGGVPATLAAAGYHYDPTKGYDVPN